MDFMEMIGAKEPREDRVLPVALTIAGSDSGGGAGIQADLKSFAAQRVHGCSVLTLVTAQNTKGVSAVQVLPDALVRAQYLAVVVEDFPPKAAKTGALGDETMVEVVAELLQTHPLEWLVVDPVMISKHGDALLPESAIPPIRERIVPHAQLVTPNIHEAEALTGRSVGSVKTMREACKRIYDMGGGHVLIKGAALGESIVRDIYYDGTGFIEYGADRIDSERLHGSGCTYSATITALLAREVPMAEAIGQAREFINGAIERAPRVGQGIAPVDPMHELFHER